MKLYTEEQVDKIALQVNNYGYWDNREVTSIELPSDEEIEEMGKDVIVYNDTKRGWFIEGLKFMRDKIQGGKQ